MLELRNLSFSIQKDGDLIDLVHDICINLPRGHFTAIVGPSGCGKTTLLKTIAGLNIESAGEIHWMGRNSFESGDLLPNEFGYVPQFSIAYDQLTVEESIECASRLRVRAWGRAARDEIIDRALEQTGMMDIADRKVGVLSGGQKRRLGLAMELVANPPLLLADEVTSGLDPRSEDEIVHLLADLAHEQNRTVISVTHSLANLQIYDSIIVLYAGCLAYHGPPSAMPHYFSVDHAEDVYPALAKRDPSQWHTSWKKHRRFYYGKLGLPLPKPPELDTEHIDDPSTESDDTDVPNDIADDEIETTAEATTESMPSDDLAPMPDDDEPTGQPDDDHESDKHSTDDADAPSADETDGENENIESEIEEEEPQEKVAKLPGILAQFILLITRRYKIFFRDRTTLILHAAILIGFPILVALFTIEGVEPLAKHGASAAATGFEQMQADIDVRESRLKSGSFVSGLIMFQVVLLSLMGANNSAREIAGERAILEKEKLGGLRPVSYLASKIVFLTLLVVAQSTWMAVFVEYFWPIPGDFISHLVMLLLVNGAMTSICLGISALMKSADQANLLSIYLVGFQLPLSGAILALPTFLEPLVRPFISAYWSWSGSVTVLDDSYNQAVRSVSETELSPHLLCVIFLGIHIGAGLVMGILGLRKNLWQH